MSHENIAAEEPHVDCLQIALRHMDVNDRDVDALDERRNTPLNIAERQGNPEILAMLQKKKARRGSPASVVFDLDGSDGLYVPDASAH